jgi:hypothetical protein
MMPLDHEGGCIVAMRPQRFDRPATCSIWLTSDSLQAGRSLRGLRDVDLVKWLQESNTHRFHIGFFPRPEFEESLVFLTSGKTPPDYLLARREAVPGNVIHVMIAQETPALDINADFSVIGYCVQSKIV